jgi:preprotein translocase subunit SecB
VYTLAQSYTLGEGAVDSLPSGGREVSFGWDWRPSGPMVFDVIITIGVNPSKEQNDMARITLAGTFRATGELPVPFAEFVRLHGPVILLPYARETLSQITSRGPFGPFLLAPLNLVGLMQRCNMTESTGGRMLRDQPDVARAFGLTL